VKKIEIPAQITGVSTRADGSLGIRITTKELTPAEKTEVFELNQQPGWFLFRTDRAFKEEEVPETDSGFEGKKPSQRLRAVIFVLWKEKYQTKFPDFEDYYRRQMEVLIEEFKGKFDQV